MYRIHPTKSKCEVKESVEVEDGTPSILTIWKKSSMAFQGTDGFSVFEKGGRLAFRVDNYSRKRRSLTEGIVLMDGEGRALLTLKPQILSMHGQWNGFEGEGEAKTRHRVATFYMRRRCILQSSDDFEVFMSGSMNHCRTSDYQIEGCFRQRQCKIRDRTGEVVAEICRKRVNTTILLSEDVFSLTVQPEFDCRLMVAFIVIMDRICQKPFTIPLCC